MKHFYMVVNKDKDPGYEIAGQIKAYLESKGAGCSFQQETQEGSFYYSDASLVPEEAECILVLGGDGTMIQAARDLVDCGLPLLGINIGTLGYLTSVDKDMIFPALDRLLQDDYEVETRMMLDGDIEAAGQERKTDLALNDIVVGRYDSLKPVHYELLVNGEVLNRYTADGIILSTPTGSTAYNLSAGGPIVEPPASLILVTPIAPHTLYNRTVILSPEDTVTVRILEGTHSKERANVAFDGNEAAVLAPGDMVTARQSQKVTKLIKLNKTSFLEILREKMSH